ncbi:MAG: hypothetical protein H5U38_07095 [Calditrichaeota bacterium]|nr:hypothetical protein [Calditrichota bacterium]
MWAFSREQPRGSVTSTGKKQGEQAAAHTFLLWEQQIRAAVDLLATTD